MPAFDIPYTPDGGRHDGRMPYRQVGRSGLRMSALSLGFWWNFGETDTFASCHERVTYAFDRGINTFDLANNYGPPYGAAETMFGRILKKSLAPYRHEMIITSKAGHDMWPGPCGDGSSRKMLMTSIDESLRRMQLDYVDIFYSHRYDGFTPVEETMQALVDIVRAGKAIYVGLSKYPADKLAVALGYLADAKVPCLIYQDKANMLINNLTPDKRALIEAAGAGFTPFSPLHGGVLTDKYLFGIPADSRAALGKHLSAADVSPDRIARLRRLNDVALRRGQTLAQMAIAWLLREPLTSSVIIGPRTIEQMKPLLQAIDNISFTPEELTEIDTILHA